MFSPCHVTCPNEYEPFRILNVHLSMPRILTEIFSFLDDGGSSLDISGVRFMAGSSSNCKRVLGSGIGGKFSTSTNLRGELTFRSPDSERERGVLIPQNAFTSSLDAIPVGWSGAGKGQAFIHRRLFPV
jgi:hypothetical protein